MAQHVLALLLSLVSLPSSRASEGSSRLENIEEVDVRVQRVSVSPAVFLIEGFLDATMCDAISAAAQPRLSDDSVDDGDQRRSARFSRSDLRDINALATASRRLRSLTRDILADQNELPDERSFLKVYPAETDYAEVPEVVRYGAGGYRRAHNEAFERDYVLTSLVFLEDTPLGGETAFPQLGFDSKIKQYAPSKFFQDGNKCAERDDELCEHGQYVGVDHAALGMEFCCCSETLRVQPRKGDAILFFNTDQNGVATQAAQHASCPVLEAEGVDESDNTKLVLRQWVHAEPLGEQSERALNPEAGEPSVEHDGAGVPFAEKRGADPAGAGGDRVFRSKAAMAGDSDSGSKAAKRGKASRKARSKQQRDKKEAYSAKGEREETEKDDL
jgi:hypothetical protein